MVVPSFCREHTVAVSVPRSYNGSGIHDTHSEVHGVLDVLGCVNPWLGSLALSIFSS